MGLGFDPLGLVGFLVAIAFLALIRMLSVSPARVLAQAENQSGKESLMKALVRSVVSFLRSMLETVWTCGAGLLVAHWQT